MLIVSIFLLSRRERSETERRDEVSVQSSSGGVVIAIDVVLNPWLCDFAKSRHDRAQWLDAIAVLLLLCEGSLAGCEAMYPKRKSFASPCAMFAGDASRDVSRCDAVGCALKRSIA